MTDKERYDTSPTSYPPGVEQASNEAYIQSIVSAMKAAGIVGANDSITGEQIAPIIAAVKMGVDTADATATPGDIVNGKTAYTGDGKITGIMPTLANSSITINVSSNGLIGAVTKNNSEVRRYLSPNGMISKTKQLPTVTGTTITPGSVNQTILTLGKYGVDNNFTVLGSPNLLSENIKAGITIFNVVGTANTVTNISYNDGITTQYITSSSGTTTIRILHMSELNFTPKAAYVYLRDTLPAANGSALISTFIAASGRCIKTTKTSSNSTMNVGSSCTWYGSSMANGALADIRIDANIGYGGPYIAAIYG